MLERGAQVFPGEVLERGAQVFPEEVLERVGGGKAGEKWRGFLVRGSGGAHAVSAYLGGL